MLSESAPTVAPEAAAVFTPRQNEPRWCWQLVPVLARAGAAKLSAWAPGAKLPAPPKTAATRHADARMMTGETGPAEWKLALRAGVSRGRVFTASVRGWVYSAAVPHVGRV